MHQIGVVGLSYRHAPVDAVARFSIPKEAVPARLPALQRALGVAELLYVGTCNRVEVVYAVPDGESAEDLRRAVFQELTGADAGEATRVLRAWTGEAAIEHLFLVACGLDSAQAGEREIATQLRLAWTAARAAGTSGPMLDRLLGEALAMSARVRRLEAAARAPSLADQAAERVRAHLLGTDAAVAAAAAGPATAGAACGAPVPTVALVGVSPMTRRCALALRSAGIPLLIVNRTVAAAEEFAAAIDARAVSLEEFRARPPAVGAVVVAAGGGGVLLAAEALERLRAAAEAPALIIDFGVPPNVPPEAAASVGLPRLGMDELIATARERRMGELLRLAPVRAAIDERLGRLRTEFATRAMGARLADLRGRFEHIAAEEIGRALEGELRNLDTAQRAALERLGATLAHRLAHLPLAGLRAAAEHASTDAVDAFFRAARLHRGAEPEANVESAYPDLKRHHA